MRHFAVAFVYAVSGLGLAASGAGWFANSALAAPGKSKQERATPPAPEPPLAQAAPAGPVRTETITYDAWTVNCRDTPEAKTKKVCLASLAMMLQQQNQRIPIGAWIIARNMDGALVSVVQTPLIDIGVLIGKGVELTIGNGKPHQINFRACNPQRCEASMTMDEATVREAPRGEQRICGGQVLESRRRRVYDQHQFNQRHR